jgi:hypothetical protein
MSDDLLNCSIDQLNDAHMHNISSLDVHYNFSLIDKAVNAIKHLRACDYSEDDILKKIHNDLERLSVDLFTIRRIYQKSFGRPLADDFFREDILSIDCLTNDVVCLMVSHEVEGIVKGSYVQFDDEDWFVTDVAPGMYTLTRTQ